MSAKKRLLPRKRRLNFIDFKLNWGDTLSRADIAEAFNVSEQQASIDLREYRDGQPDNLMYDVSAKKYKPTKQFVSEFKSSSGRSFLKHLRRLKTKTSVSWVRHDFPCAIVSGPPSRHVDTKQLRVIVKAINNNQLVEAMYVSQSSGQTKRRLTPHSLVGDGLRWHIRSYDHESEQFSDFVLSRLSKVKIERDDEVLRMPLDTSWHQKIEVRFEPASTNLATRKATAREFGMKKEVLILKTTKALLFYKLRKYGFNPRPQTGAMRNESSLALRLMDFEKIQEALKR